MGWVVPRLFATAVFIIVALVHQSVHATVCRMKGVSDLSERPGFFRPIVDASPGGIAKVRVCGTDT